MFESPGYFGVYKTIRSTTCCCIILYGSQQTFSFWAWFHEKEELLRGKCLLCVSLLVSEHYEQAQSTSAEHLKTTRFEACLQSHGRLVCWEVSVPTLLAFSSPSSSTEAPGTTFHTLLDGFFCQSNNLNPVGHVHVMCLPSTKGIWHSHQPCYSQCISVKHQLVITTTRHRTIHCKGRGRQGWSLVCFS